MSFSAKCSRLHWVLPLLLVSSAFAACVDDHEGVRRVRGDGGGGEAGSVGAPAAGGSGAGEPPASAAGTTAEGEGGSAGAADEPLELGWSTSFALPGINGP